MIPCLLYIKMYLTSDLRGRYTNIIDSLIPAVLTGNVSAERDTGG